MCQKGQAKVEFIIPNPVVFQSSPWVLREKYKYKLKSKMFSLERLCKKDFGPFSLKDRVNCGVLGGD